MSQRPPLVLIEWLDSGHPVPGWTWLRTIVRGEPHRCVSVGFLMRDDIDAKVIVPNLGSSGGDMGWDQLSGVITIPAQAVTRMVRLTPEAEAPFGRERPRLPARTVDIGDGQYWAA